MGVLGFLFGFGVLPNLIEDGISNPFEGITDVIFKKRAIERKKQELRELHDLRMQREAEWQQEEQVQQEDEFEITVHLHDDT
jgi:hypothetical protein